MSTIGTIAFLGNPNSGKSTLYNLLAGTQQRVGNYPGVTVDIKSVVVQTRSGRIRLVDLPGLYSVYPTAADEKLVVDYLLTSEGEDTPDAILYTVNAAQIESQLLLLTQLMDMGYRIVLAVNMIDELENQDYTVHIERLQRKLGLPVIAVSSRTEENIGKLKDALIAVFNQNTATRKAIYTNKDQNGDGFDYSAYLRQQRIDEKSAGKTPDAVGSKFSPLQAQVAETLERSELIKTLLSGVILNPRRTGMTGLADRLLTHWLVGPAVFAIMMLLVFQAIFAWATYPMDLIESFFGWAGAEVKSVLPGGWLTSLITDGLLAGLSGVLVFVPQIAILFFLITILEEVGYMARAVYLFDRLMQRFGMNGRSIVALISGGACAIPAIMSTRTIENWKERLITILVTPFISCSARIPVFTVLVAFVVPYEDVWGIFNTQGLAFAGLYVLGIGAALLAAWVFKKILKSRDPSFLVLELPKYRKPDWINVWVQVRSKSGAFITEAGKVILLVALVLWFLASYGPKQGMASAESRAAEIAIEQNLGPEASGEVLAAEKLEASFAGILGKTIEPVIRPLGYDWKIGIALITSFAAREVFVGSMATIYSVGSNADEFKVREHLTNVVNPETGKKVFNPATSLSLLLFYVFALQCMSTMAVVRKETGSWKWPLIQFTFMAVVAYLVSWAGYQWLS